MDGQSGYDGAEGQAPLFGRDAGRAESERTYRGLLSATRQEAARLVAENEEIARLEAIVKGRTTSRMWRHARLAAVLVLLPVLIALAIVLLPLKPETVVLGGILLHALWLAEMAGLCLKRAQRRTGTMTTAARGTLAALALLQAVLVAMVFSDRLAPAAISMFAATIVAGVFSGFFGSSGDALADRIHEELFSARVKARRTEASVSRLEERLRRVQSADLASVSRVAPWPESAAQHHEYDDDALGD